MQKALDELRRKYAGSACVIGVLLVFVQLQSVAVSYFMGGIVDTIIAGDFARARAVAIISGIVVLLFASIGTYAHYYKGNQTYKLTYDIKSLLFGKILHATYADVQKMGPSYLTKRVNDDAQGYAGYVLSERVGFWVSAIAAAITCVLIATISPSMLLLIAVVIALYYAFYMIISQKLFVAEKRNRQTQNEYFATESKWLDRVKLIKLENLYTLFGDALAGAFGKAFAANKNSGRVKGGYNIVGAVLSVLSMVAIILFALWSIDRGMITVGAFVITFNLYNILNGYVGQLLNFGTVRQAGLVSQQRMDEIYSMPQESVTGLPMEPIHTLALHDVSFAYEGAPSCIRGLSHTFERGHVYLISGDNGAGKSALFDLIAALMHPQQGEVHINGQPLAAYGAADVRRGIAYATQEAILLEGPVVGQGALFGLGDGYTGPQGLSGGEKKKILLDRTFLKDVQLLLLDEPEASLDADSIERLKRAIQETARDKIVIIITHTHAFDGLGEDISLF